jgi:hypothetical protein
MSTIRNNRKRAISTFNPFENAEGIIPLTFKGLRLHSLGEKDFTSKRNGLDITKFTAINPINGDTIGVLVQCDLRDKVLAAFERVEAGEIATLKNIYGGRAGKSWDTGMTTLVAKSLELEFSTPVKRSATAIDVPVNVPVELVAQAELAAAELDGTIQ